TLQHHRPAGHLGALRLQLAQPADRAAARRPAVRGRHRPPRGPRLRAGHRLAHPEAPTMTTHRSTYGVGTRLKQPPSDELKAFFDRAYLSTFDETAFQAVARINLAHTVMLEEV